jgi:hypothetical protein
VSKTLVESSKASYGVRDSGGRATHEEIHTGCLQRVATACEAMSQNWSQLVRERDSWERTARSNARYANSLERSNAALRGVITKLKRAKK